MGEVCFSFTNNKGSEVSWLGELHPLLVCWSTYKMKGLGPLTSWSLPMVFYNSRDLPKPP